MKFNWYAINIEDELSFDQASVNIVHSDGDWCSYKQDGMNVNCLVIKKNRVYVWHANLRENKLFIMNYVGLYTTRSGDHMPPTPADAILYKKDQNQQEEVVVQEVQKVVLMQLNVENDR